MNGSRDGRTRKLWVHVPLPSDAIILYAAAAAYKINNRDQDTEWVQDRILQCTDMKAVNRRWGHLMGEKYIVSISVLTALRHPIYFTTCA
jgi:hypothetical protein